MKILHTADIHLGDLTGPTKDGRNVRRQDTIACIKHIVEVAQEERPNVSIIAGDLFNRSRVWADTALDDVNDAIIDFIRPLCLCSERVVLLFGTENHDNPRAFETLKELMANEPNLYICTTPEVFEVLLDDGHIQIAALPGFDRGRLRLFSVGADQEAENRNATALVNDVALGLATQLDKSKPSILVAHYTVSGAEADNGSTFLAGQDVVILPTTIDMMGVDLACFGHIHRPQRLECSTPAYYCGSPNQLNFNDEGIEHGFYIHELTEADGKPNMSSRFIPTPERRHFTLRLSEHDIGAFLRDGNINFTLLGDAPIKDAIVRIRYSCTPEQDKALNRAELQKQIMAAGSFFVSEVLPEDMEDVGAGNEITEHDGPAETLALWFEINGIMGADAERLTELALPIIKKADDGRDTNKHTGAFVPLTIEVKNYRSYTEAVFDFESVHMAMVNGSNGVGKSSLFMDAIADCLFEETRKEDVGGWVRDGTKSGAITFNFLMGGQTYRAVRTRTKTGRGTLALHRMNADTQEWEDESDTTMRLTQVRIERLLGMDCNTFCSIALIRQDAYGLFLEADSDRRMEVLSALLGLDIYVRMESIAKDAATEQRRRIAATKERITILNEQIEVKAGLLSEDENLANQDATARAEMATLEVVLSSAQRADAMRQELMRQADEKANEAQEYGSQAALKTRDANDAQCTLDTARELGASLTAAKQAANAVNTARLQLDELAPHEEELRNLRRQETTLKEDIGTCEQDIQRLNQDADTLSAILVQRESITQAQNDLAALQSERVATEERRTTWDVHMRRVNDAKSTMDTFVADSRIRIGNIDAQIKDSEKRAALLDNSGCPVPDTATCNFLSDAVQARASLHGLQTQLSNTKADDRQKYERLAALHADEEKQLAALGNPTAELTAITAKERELKLTADMAGKLEAAQARLESIEQQRTTIQAHIRNVQNTLDDITAKLPVLEKYANRAEAARKALRDNEALADMLPQCVAAGATIAAMEPVVERLRQEVHVLKNKQTDALLAADQIRSTIPTGESNLAELQTRRLNLDSDITRIAGERGGIKARLETIAEAERQAAEKRAEVEEIAHVLNDYTTLVQAFGLDGIQYMIIRGIVPEIMRRANDILASMTSGRMTVDIRTEKEQRSSQKIVNSLEVWINTINGGSRPYQSHSGGEKVKIALAVTLSLADVKARRAGVQLGMLFIDEPPFLDADGTEAYADALTNMGVRNPGMRILAISHDPTMKARFSQNIVVTATENGSVVSMEH